MVYLLALGAIFLLLVIFVLANAGAVLRQWRRRQDRTLWLFAGCFVLGIALELANTYSPLNEVLGVANLAWLVSRLSFVLSAYFLTATLAVEAGKVSLLTGMRLGLFGILTGIGLAFGLGRASAKPADYAVELVAVDGRSFVAAGLMFGYILGMLLLLARLYYRLFKQEQVTLLRPMWLAQCGFSLDAALLIVARLALTWGYLIPLPPLVLTGLKYTANATLVILVLWPLLFNPSWTHRLFLRPLQYLQTLATLHNLLTLYRACRLLPVRFETPVPLQVSLWRALTQPRTCIYQLLIANLDFKHTAKAELTVRDPGHWVYEWLTLDDEVDYQTQVKQYARLGRRLRQERYFE